MIDGYGRDENTLIMPSCTNFGTGILVGCLDRLGISFVVLLPATCIVGRHATFWPLGRIYSIEYYQLLSLLASVCLLFALV